MGASKRLVELLQLLSVRWKIDQAAISVYHTYSVTNHAGKFPELAEFHLQGYVTKHSDVHCKGEVIIASWVLQILITKSVTDIIEAVPVWSIYHLFMRNSSWVVHLT